jgi:transposase
MAITFKLKLEKPCVLCTCYTDKDGYGRRPFHGKAEQAHRVAYAEAHGLSMDDIRGLHIRHKCDNPPCIEPTHLLAGTNDDNVRDKVERRRMPRGEKHHRSKLLLEQVIAIRQRFAEGVIAKDIAKEYDVSKGAVDAIKYGHAWAWVGEKQKPKQHCQHRKLTADQVREIKFRLAVGESSGLLALEYGVSQPTICNIKAGRVWAWLTA